MSPKSTRRKVQTFPTIDLTRNSTPDETEDADTHECNIVDLEIDKCNSESDQLNDGSESDDEDNERTKRRRKIDSKSKVEIKEVYKNEPVFKNVPKKWGREQEVLLLEGVEANGLFKWDMIAKQLSEQSGKTFKVEEVKNHYYQYYYDGTLGQVWNYELEKAPKKHFDHTDPIVCSSNKYLPPVVPSNLRQIKFLPHREDFEEFPPNEIETMVTRVDFSSYYMQSLKNLDKEVRKLQLFVVDSYRKVIADRLRVYKFMKDFKLIEQYFYVDCKKTFKKCEIEKQFNGLQKFVGFFNSPEVFVKFYFDCVKEKLLKLEIARLCQVLATRRRKERDPEVKIMLKKRAPSFLNVGLLLNANKEMTLKRSKKRKNRSKFTRKKSHA